MGFLRLLVIYYDKIDAYLEELEYDLKLKEYKYMFITDPKTNKKSITATAFVVGFVISCIKLLISGMTIGDHLKFSDFSGSDFSLVMAALGAVYTLRRTSSQQDKPAKEKK